MSPLTHEPLIDALAPAAFTTFDLRETGAVQLVGSDYSHLCRLRKRSGPAIRPNCHSSVGDRPSLAPIRRQAPCRVRLPGLAEYLGELARLSPRNTVAIGGGQLVWESRQPLPYFPAMDGHV